MYDRPNLSELIEAARLHMETAVIPAVKADRKLYFQTLVAINVLKIAERELLLGDAHAQAEWESLNTLEGVDTPIPNRLSDIKDALSERNAALSAAIRTGAYDDTVLLHHLKMTTTNQLEVANPKYLEKLAYEDAHPEADAWQNR